MSSSTSKRNKILLARIPRPTDCQLPRSADFHLASLIPFDGKAAQSFTRRKSMRPGTIRVRTLETALFS